MEAFNTRPYMWQGWIQSGIDFNLLLLFDQLIKRALVEKKRPLGKSGEDRTGV